MTRIVYGVRPVMELLHYPDRVQKILYQEGRERGAVSELVDLAIGNGIMVEAVHRQVLDKLADDSLHQGILAKAEQYPYADLRMLLTAAPPQGVRRSVVLACDQITDPQNFGSMVRTLEALGGLGAIITTRRSVEVTPAVCKASSGAIEHLRVAQVVNLKRALDTAREEGYLVCGLDMQGERSVYDDPGADKLVLVVGSEGKGMRELSRQTCDVLVSIPMAGRVESLNASISAGITLALWLGPKS